MHDLICDDLYTPMKFKELAVLLQVAKEDRDALRMILEELEEEEQKKEERRGDYYGKSILKNSNRKRRHNLYVFTQEDLDNDDIISMVETTPTYKRTKAVLEAIQSKATAEDKMTQKLESNESGSMTITF